MCMRRCMTKEPLAVEPYTPHFSTQPGNRGRNAALSGGRAAPTGGRKC